MSNADLADFATTSKGKGGGKRTGFGPIVHALAWCLALAFLAFVVPRFEVIFKDFGLSMGWSMRLIVRASHLLFILVPLVAILVSADKFVLDALSRREDDRGMSRAWSVLMLWTPLLAIALMVGSLGFAMFNLTSRLTG